MKAYIYICVRSQQLDMSLVIKQQMFFNPYKVIAIWATLRFYPSGGGCTDFSEIKCQFQKGLILSTGHKK